MKNTYDYTVIGGGIVGLSTARHIVQHFPKARVLVLEKEPDLAAHQTGRNSGVLHSGIYYKPGSFKARFAKAGVESMVAFCREHGIEFDICGKLIVATKESELPELEKLHARAQANGVPCDRISAEQAREVEPHVQAIAALQVHSTGITDYTLVCRAMLEQIRAHEGEICFESEVIGMTDEAGIHIIETKGGEYRTKFVVNCAGLHSDRIAKLFGQETQARIVPFRGEYFELIESRRHLVKGLIYPVPNPDFPFLGVHLTRMIDGSIHAGPNAVLAFAREGYRRRDINLRDLSESLSYGGFWKLVAKNWQEGAREMYRSFSKAAFTRSLQELVPEVQMEDLQVCKAGVRAQALLPDGSMVDDFLLIDGPNTLHVCNAPSPAATAALEIGKEVASRLPDMT